MDDLSRQLAGAREHLRSDWDDARTEQQLVRLKARLRRRTVGRAAGGAAVVALAAAAAVVLWTGGPGPDAEGASLPRDVQTVRFSDGSSATALDGRALLTVVEVSRDKVLVELATGSAAFDVTPNPGREFVVRAGDVRVVVLGTRFRVVRTDDRVRVSVQRGSVSVRWGEEEASLAEGDTIEVPGPRGGAEAGDGEEPTAAAEPAGPGTERSVPPPRGAPDHEPAVDWRQLAEAGEYDAAFDALSSRSGQVGTHADDLMLAADAARLSGHPGDAVGYLRRVVDDHPEDPRAPLAAFTLGRVLLSEVGRPQEAAGAFAQARALDPRSALAQDALAREVEAWYRGGEQERATQLGREYLALYPSGVHVAAVRRYAALPSSPSP